MSRLDYGWACQLGQVVPSLGEQQFPESWVNLRPDKPHQTHMSELTGKDAADRAINQLLSVIVGRQHAKETDELKADPSQRVKACTQLVSVELSEAASLLADCVPDAKRMMSQAQRKIDSLGSLAVLASLIKEVDWD